jgi:hypothetical protein
MEKKFNTLTDNARTYIDLGGEISQYTSVELVKKINKFKVSEFNYVKAITLLSDSGFKLKIDKSDTQRIPGGGTKVMKHIYENNGVEIVLTITRTSDYYLETMNAKLK